MRRSILLVLFVCLLTACSGAAQPVPPTIQPTQSVSNTEASSATPVTLVADLVPVTTYTDSNLGYEFDYPADWTISALPEVPYSAVTIHSWDPEELTEPRSQGEGLPEGGEKMDILPMAGYGADFAQAMPSFREGNQSRSFSEEAVTLPSGSAGILIRFEPVAGELEVNCLLTAVSDITILLCGSGWDLQYFEPIAFSLRGAN